MELAHQLCPILRECREFEVLWATLASGNHDWLRVRRNGEPLVGRLWLSDVVPDDASADGRPRSDRSSGAPRDRSPCLGHGFAAPLDPLTESATNPLADPRPVAR